MAMNDTLFAIGSRTMGEIFFSLLKRERIRRRAHKTREEAKADALPGWAMDYIKMFNNL
jgi:hypothetical protein